MIAVLGWLNVQTFINPSLKSDHNKQRRQNPTSSRPLTLSYSLRGPSDVRFRPIPECL